MRIGLLHGWLLDGSGSNVYVRETARALVGRGHDVTVVCQEPFPERFPRAGRILRPAIDTGVMPVYVADTAYPGFAKAEAFSELAGSAVLEAYLEDFAAGTAKFCREHGVEVLHANHVYPMPEVARRVKRSLGIPYVVFPHGSAIEYAVKRSEAIKRAAAAAIDEADALIVGNKTVTERLFGLYPERREAWSKKHSIIPVGVDPELFTPVGDYARDELPRILKEAGLPPGGRTARMTEALVSREYKTDQPILNALNNSLSEYDRKAPDADLPEKLSRVDWASGRILLYAGKLIASKGVHDLLAALPELLERRPETHLILVGEGPMREGLELFASALSRGDKALTERLIRLGGALGRQPEIKFDNVMAYVDRLGFDRWLEAGVKTNPARRVFFTGYLRHEFYRHVLPRADVAVFPSEIAEAYPLVLLEALSAGVLPAATDYEGLGEGITAIAAGLPGDLGPRMKISRDSWNRIPSMVRGLSGLLGSSTDWKQDLRRMATRDYSWDSAAGGLEKVYARILQAARS